MRCYSPKGSSAVKQVVFGTGFGQGYDDLCNKCRDELKRDKQQQKSSSGTVKSQSSSNVWGIIWQVLKWIFSPIWGGPYLIISGLKNKSKLWLSMGIEFTLVLIVFAILTNAIPDFTTSENAFYNVLSTIFGVLFIGNLIALIVYIVKFKDDFKEDYDEEA